MTATSSTAADEWLKYYLGRQRAAIEPSSASTTHHYSLGNKSMDWGRRVTDNKKAGIPAGLVCSRNGM
jgi:hypothetical protein